jgi:NitT/TauT family transport system substrate-binding protein
MNRLPASCATSLCILLFLFGCAPPAPPALTPVVVQLQWTHQAQFAGFYAADQNGYYSAEGLAVTFIEGGAEVERFTPVLDGSIQFGMATGDELILARAEGKPLRAIATIYRRSPIVFIALDSTGVTGPEDFAGKTIRVSANLVPSLHAMTTRVGVTPDQYTEVVLPSDVAAFGTGDVPIWGGFSTGFLVSVLDAGYEVNLIYPDDYGVHFYADTLFASDEFIASQPELILRFLRATFKGWTYAVEHADEMGAMVLQYKPEANPALENAKMIASIPLVNTGEDFIGWMKPEIWAGMEETLREQSVLTAPLDVTDAYTLQFIEELYK